MKDNTTMKIIKLDASKWQTALDFYDGILLALGAPEWHGRGVDALVESMIWGEINDVEPPYAVEIYSTKHLPAEVLQQMTWVNDFIIEARAEFNVRQGHDVEVSFKVFD